MEGKILKTDKIGNALKLSVVLNGNPNILNKIAALQEKPVSVEIKEVKEKRSLEQNSKLWAVLTDMSEVLHSSPNEIYEEMLQRYAPATIVTLQADVDPGYLFKHYSLYKEGTLKGIKFIAYKVYTGSSKMNIGQMSAFLEGVINEAKELGIDTEKYEVENGK